MTRQHISRRRLIAGGAGAGAGVLGGAAMATAGRASASGHWAGGVQALFDPVRLFDSRRSDSPRGGVKLSGGDVVSIMAAAPGVDTITTVFLNLTITETEGAGYLSVRRGGEHDGPDVPPPTTSNINWTAPGVTLANTALSGVDAVYQLFEVHCTGVGAATHLIVDLQGYVPFVVDQ
jgi:hypothetical protein